MSEFIIKLNETLVERFNKSSRSPVFKKLNKILDDHGLRLEQYLTAQQGISPYFYLAAKGSLPLDEPSAREALKELQQPAMQSLVSAAYEKPSAEPPTP